MTRRNHPTDVLPGQEWSVLFMRLGSRTRVEMRVDRLEPHPEGLGLIAHCVSLRTGKAFDVRAATLSSHLRGARLVRHADGQSALPPKPVLVEPVERAPARAKDKLPRGLRPLTPRDVRIRELRAQGLTATTIAPRVGIRVEAVRESFVQLDDWAAYEGVEDDGSRTIGLERRG